MQILSYFLSPELQQMLVPFKIFSIGISVILLLAVGFFLTQTPWLYYRYWAPREDFLAYRPRKKGKIALQWKAIERRLERGSEEELRLAVSEADAILRETVGRMGLPGETIEDQLGAVDPSIFPSASRVRDALQRRNRIIQDPGFRVTKDEARDVLDVYRQAFEDLELL